MIRSIRYIGIKSQSSSSSSPNSTTKTKANHSPLPNTYSSPVEITYISSPPSRHPHYKSIMARISTLFSLAMFVIAAACAPIMPLERGCFPICTETSNSDLVPVGSAVEEFARNPLTNWDLALPETEERSTPIPLEGL